MGLLFGRCISRLVRGRLDGQELVKNLYKMAVKSLPIVVVTALFTGAIMVIQAAVIVKRYNAEGLLGWGAGDDGGHRADRRVACLGDRPHRVPRLAALSVDHLHALHDDALCRRAGAV